MDSDVTVYYHKDNDGVLSGHLIYSKYPEAKFIPVQYGDKWEEADVKDKKVFVVDFSFPDMIAIRDLCAALVWCDHHSTAKKIQTEAWDDSTIAGLRSLDFAGCMLTYAYINNIPLENIDVMVKNYTIPYVVSAIAKYDTWKHKRGDDADAFNAAFTVKIRSHTSDDLPKFFDLGRAHIENTYIAIGETLLEAAMARVKGVVAHETPVIVKDGDKAITILVVNSTSDKDLAGSYINADLCYDIAAIYRYEHETRKDGKVEKPDRCIVSLRSLTCNVAVIAEKLQGGGHPGAASFVISQSPAQMKETLQGTIFRNRNAVVKK
jgi:oligoribonuclease NrnB/cAMP/cGMP phosphodiesterase (DHH superfamily)